MCSYIDLMLKAAKEYSIKTGARTVLVQRTDRLFVRCEKRNFELPVVTVSASGWFGCIDGVKEYQRKPKRERREQTN